MNLESFLLCDAATDQQGKLNVLGAFDNIFENVNHRWAYVSGMMYVSGSVYESGMSDEETQVFMDGMVENSVSSFQKTFGASRWWTSYIPGL